MEVSRDIWHWLGMTQAPLEHSPIWQREDAPIPYGRALVTMEDRNAAIAQNKANELFWLLEHPPVYTGGTSAKAADLLDPRFDVFETGRGGQYTYHGPGQRVCYVMLNLAQRRRDLRNFVCSLEQWVIDTLGDFGVNGRRAEGRIGIWTDDEHGREAKIGAIGVRVRKWVTMHGFAVNLSPDLAHFSGIVPCGISEFPVTSLRALGKEVKSNEWDEALIARSEAFLQRLDPTHGSACETTAIG